MRDEILRRYATAISVWVLPIVTAAISRLEKVVRGKR